MEYVRVCRKPVLKMYDDRWGRIIPRSWHVEFCAYYLEKPFFEKIQEYQTPISEIYSPYINIMKMLVEKKMNLFDPRYMIQQFNGRVSDPSKDIESFDTDTVTNTEYIRSYVILMKPEIVEYSWIFQLIVLRLAIKAKFYNLFNVRY